MTPKQIKAIRIANCMRQVDLAKHIGVHVSSVRNWEQGIHRPRLLHVAKLKKLERKDNE